MSPLSDRTICLFCLFVFNLCALLFGDQIHSLSSDPFVSFGSGSLVPPHANSFDSLDLLIASETSRNHYRKSGKQARLGKINYSDDKGYANSISSGPNSDKSSNDYYMPISAAVQTSKHMIDVKEVDINSEPFSPQTVIVDATVMPLTIYFRSTSSMVKVIQEHLEGKGDIQHTQSEEEPHRLFHEVHKPIIQEVHEVIKPYRRIIQEMQPVYEDVKTIISRPFEGSRQPEQMYKDISPYERNRFSVNDDRVSGYITNMNNFNEDLMRITQTINDNNVPQTNLTLAPKAQLSDYASEVPSDVGLGYHGTNTRNERNSQDIRNTRDKVDSLSGVINSTTSSTTTTSTTPVPSVEVSSTAKRKRHRTPVVKTSTKRVHKTHVTNKDSSSDLTRSRRLAIKRLVNKIDREKRKIRLGFFGIYGINLIPYIYDQFAYDVKIRVPSSNKQTTQ